jgi:hypothetical protein
MSSPVLLLFPPPTLSRLRVSVLESEEGHGRRRPGQQTKDAEGWELRALAIENEMEEQRVKAEVGSCVLAPLHKGVWGVCVGIISCQWAADASGISLEAP